MMQATQKLSQPAFILEKKEDNFNQHAKFTLIEQLTETKNVKNFR